MPRTDTEAMALANACFADCKVVLEFMLTTAKVSVDRHSPTTEPTGTVRATFLRALDWMGTLSKLNHPSDFQAAIAGTRALFEMAVDLTLLVGDRAKYPVEKLIAWEESAKLKQAAAMVARAAAHSSFEIPDVLDPFVRAEGARIQALRDHRWPNKKGKPSEHPARWTGQNLRDDSVAADAFGIGPRDLEDFYVSRHSELCWLTHGSGATGVRHLDADIFPGLIVKAYADASDFGMRCSKLALTYMGAYDSIAEARFEHASRERTAHRVEGYRQWKQLR